MVQGSLGKGECEGWLGKLIYHSHCDCGAYFSQTDQDAAAPDGALAYPVAFLVTSVLEGRIADRKVFTLGPSGWAEPPFSVP